MIDHSLHLANHILSSKYFGNKHIESSLVFLIFFLKNWILFGLFVGMELKTSLKITKSALKNIYVEQLISKSWIE